MLDEHAMLVALDVFRVHPQRDPPLADAALHCYELEFFAEHARSPGHQERAEKGKAALDQAANVSLEILVAELNSATSSRVGSTTVRLQTPVGGPLGRS